MSTSSNFFSWRTRWYGNLLLDNDILINQYDIAVDFIPNSPAIHDQNKSFERIKYFFNVICNSSIVANMDNKNLPNIWKNFSTNIITLPNEPFDQQLAACLFAKLQSISVDQISVFALTLESYQGENVSYTVDSTQITNSLLLPTAEILRMKREPWWYQGNTKTNDIKEIQHRGLEWDKLNLLFEEKPVNVNKKHKQFNPIIIEGGKNNED
jgi:hypothetical protein